MKDTSSNAFWSWLAGFVDGEGSFSMCEGYGIRLHITNTNLPTLCYIKECCKKGILYNKPRFSKKNSKGCYRIFFSRHECKDITRRIYPFLVLKKEHARLILQAPINPSGVVFSNAQRKLRARLKERLAKLNKRGRL